MPTKVPTWRKLLPNLGFALELPLIRMRVRVLYEALDQYEIVEWFTLEWRVWKYSGQLRLYWKGRL